jgi:hypothetical protein
MIAKEEARTARAGMVFATAAIAGLPPERAAQSDERREAKWSRSRAEAQVPAGRR